MVAMYVELAKKDRALKVLKIKSDLNHNTYQFARSSILSEAEDSDRNDANYSQNSGRSKIKL